MKLTYRTSIDLLHVKYTLRKIYDFTRIYSYFTPKRAKSRFCELTIYVYSNYSTNHLFRVITVWKEQADLTRGMVLTLALLTRNVLSPALR